MLKNKPAARCVDQRVAGGTSNSVRAKGAGVEVNSIGIVQRTNLRYLDNELKQHWNLGKNILLCWCLDSKGIQVLLAPYYFFGHLSASLSHCDSVDRLEVLNGQFIQELISGSRLLSASDFRSAASRLQLAAVAIPLPVPLARQPELYDAVDNMIKRYSINYVKSRAVLLFDIVNFSLAAPFEQTSQLNSLCYSLNSAQNQLRQQSIEVNFSRSMTGDGYYVWHEDDTPRANVELFQFMLLVLADNALAKRAVKSLNGQLVPCIRTGFHIGSHFEFYQLQGMNSDINSFIVGDVTIELARMLELAASGQIFIGDFTTMLPTSPRSAASVISVDSPQFVEQMTREMVGLQGVSLWGDRIAAVHCFLTGNNSGGGAQTAHRISFTDSHGCCCNVYNLRINIRTNYGSEPLILGLQDRESLTPRSRRRSDMRKVKLAALSSLRLCPDTSAAAFD